MSDLKDPTPSKPRLVVKANDLVEAKYRLTVQEQKLILMAISKINPTKPDFENPYRLSVEEVAEACGLEKTGVYQKVAATVDKLMTRLVKLKEDDGHRVVHWVSEAKYYTGMGHFDLWFHEKMKPYLLDLKEFISYDRKEVLQFQSRYSFRILEILKKWKGANERNQFSVKVDQLRETLGIRKTEYKLFGDFNRYVIKKAQAELSEQSKITFDYNVWKEGRAVAGIIFTIKDNVPTGKPAKKKRGRPKKEDKSIKPSINLFDELEAKLSYSEELIKKLMTLGVRHLDKYEKEGIAEKHFLASIAKHESDENPSTGKIVESAREEYQKESINSESKKQERKQSDIIASNKRYWESNKLNFVGIHPSEAYLQDDSGAAITWADEEFVSKLKKYRKQADDERSGERRSGKKTLFQGSSLVSRSNDDRRKENLGRSSRGEN